MRSYVIALILTAFLTMQCVSAVTVNIKYGGQTKGAAEISPEQVINWDINVNRNASDFTWSRVNVHVSAISGDSARPIAKMYLYRCKAYKPLDCITKADVPEPLDFGSYADADLSWSDISAASGLLRYPQVANLMLLAKLEGENEAWVGVFIKIERTDYNQFNIPFNYELGDVDVYPLTESLIEPVRTYINNFHMIPMKWVGNVSIQGSTLYALGANKEEFEAKPVNFRPERPTGQIKQITKDFYLVFAETIEGVANPVTLNINPTSQCGDGTCQSALGESSGSCCYDCGCGSGQFCDVPNTTSLEAGVCRQGSIGLEISGLFQSAITNCESEGSTHFTARVTNAPSGLVTEEFSGTLEMEDFILPVECTGTATSLDCSFDHGTDVACGGFDRAFEAKFTLPIEYYNGQNTIITELHANKTGTIKYQCKCGEGMFCSTNDNSCQDEESMALTILDFTSTKYSVKTGGTIKMAVQIDGAPPNYTVAASRYTIQEILQDEDVLPGLAGLMNCTPYEDYGEPDVLSCVIPYTISGYDRTLEYTLSKGKISLKVDYNDVGAPKSRTLATDMPDTVIPMSECGDGTCDKEKGESEKTCCMDCGCGKNATDMYCDENKGCNSIGSVGLSVQSLQPTSFDDCAVDHKATLKAMIGSGGQQSSNAGGSSSDGLTGQLTGMAIAVQSTRQSKAGVPTGLTVDSYELLENGGPSEYASISCDDANEVTGALNCQVEIASIDECKSAKTIGPLELQVEASWPNGAEDAVSTTLTATVPSITVKPTYEAGDGECEENYGESAANSCFDCPCADDPKYGSGYYCDSKGKAGACRPLSSVTLSILQPTSTVKVQTCMEDYNMPISASIKNAPSGTSLQSATATIDGQPATVKCTQNGGLGGSLSSAAQTGGGTLNAMAVAEVTGRSIEVEPTKTCTTCGIKPTSGGLDGGSGTMTTFTCTLTLPADPKCDDTKQYTHSSTLTIFISYSNGGSSASGSLTQQLPEMVVNGPDEEQDQGTEDAIAYVENLIKEQMAQLARLEAEYQNCNGQWDDTAKGASKALMYSSSQTQAEALAGLLCRGVEGSTVPKEIKDAACVMLEGAGAAASDTPAAQQATEPASNIDLNLIQASISVETDGTGDAKTIKAVKYRLQNDGSQSALDYKVRIQAYARSADSESLVALAPQISEPTNMMGGDFPDRSEKITSSASGSTQTGSSTSSSTQTGSSTVSTTQTGSLTTSTTQTGSSTSSSTQTGSSTIPTTQTGSSTVSEDGAASSTQTSSSTVSGYVGCQSDKDCYSVVRLVQDKPHCCIIPSGASSFNKCPVAGECYECVVDGHCSGGKVCNSGKCGYSTTGQVASRPSTAGAVVIKVEIFVDYDNKVAESKEDNNCYSIDVDGKVTTCGEAKASAITTFLKSEPGKRFTAAALTELEKRFGYQLSFPVAGAQVDVDLPIGQFLAEMISGRLGITPGGLSGTKEQIKATGSAMTEAQNADCKGLALQISALKNSIAKLHYMLQAAKCQDDYDKKMTAGKCDKLQLVICNEELKRCNDNLDAALGQWADEINALDVESEIASQKKQNALQQAAAAGHAVYVKDTAEVFFDADNDLDPDTVCCGAGDVTIMAWCASGTPEVKKVDNGVEMALGGQWTAPSGTTPAAVAPTAKPDLRVSPYSVVVCTNDKKSLKSVKFDIENSGTATGSSFIVKTTRTFSGSSAQPQVVEKTTSLSGTKMTWPSSETLGTQPAGQTITKVFIEIDSGKAVEESKEDNNALRVEIGNNEVHVVDEAGIELATAKIDDASCKTALTSDAASAQAAESAPSKSDRYWTKAVPISSLFGSEEKEYTFSLYCGSNKAREFSACYCSKKPCSESTCAACTEYFQEQETAAAQSGSKTFCTAEMKEACKSQTKICDEASRACISCNVDSDCTSLNNGKICQNAGKPNAKCVECVRSDDCASGICEDNACWEPDLKVGDIAVCKTFDEAAFSKIGFYVENIGHAQIFQDIEVEIRIETIDGQKKTIKRTIKDTLAGDSKVWIYLVGSDLIYGITSDPYNEPEKRPNKITIVVNPNSAKGDIDEKREDNNQAVVRIVGRGVEGTQHIFKQEVDAYLNERGCENFGRPERLLT